MELARKLEQAEATAGRRFIEARMKLRPQHGSCWIRIAGATAMFDGCDSPVTQTFGLGMYEPVTMAALGEMEAFFRRREAPVYHEVCPLADASAREMLVKRGYAPVEFTSVLYLALPAAVETHSEVTARKVTEAEWEVWARTGAEGWRGHFETGFVFDLGLVCASRAGEASFLVELDGKPAAAGTTAIDGEVAVLAGASTVPEFRRRGAQTALLAARLQHATHAGCRIAMMCAAPGSASQRNAERAGFRIAYTRIKWMLRRDAV